MNKMNLVYHPVDGDKVDKYLAEVLNDRRSGRMPKMFFVREAEGVYTYGKKKVYIKTDGKKLIIRVGGGYMSLDEFIDTFNPLALYKPK